MNCVFVWDESLYLPLLNRLNKKYTINIYMFRYVYGLTMLICVLY